MAFVFHFFFLSFLSFSHHSGKEFASNEIKHPFYVSVTEINHNAAEKTLEISCKFFADDFENTLEKAFKTKLDITSEKDKASFDKFIPAYVSQHLGLSVEGKPVKLAYIGYEKDQESVYCYFEVANTAAVKKIDITNNLLYDFTTEQINIMHITVNGKRQSTKLSHPEVRAAYQF